MCSRSLWNVPSEGARRETLGRSTLVLGRRVGEINGSRRSGSRVGNAWVVRKKNAQSLPLECSVRGGEARDTGSLSTCSGTTLREKETEVGAVARGLVTRGVVRRKILCRSLWNVPSGGARRETLVALHLFRDDASEEKRTSVQRLEGWQRMGSSVALIVRGRQTAVFQKRAEYGNAETSVAPSGMIRRMERDVAAKRSVAPSGMIRQRERQARYSSNNLSLTLVFIKGLSRRRFRVVVRREEREEVCRTALSRLDLLLSRGLSSVRWQRLAT